MWVWSVEKLSWADQKLWPGQAKTSFDLWPWKPMTLGAESGMWHSVEWWCMKFRQIIYNGIYIKLWPGQDNITDGRTNGPIDGRNNGQCDCYILLPIKGKIMWCKLLSITIKLKDPSICCFEFWMFDLATRVPGKYSHLISSTIYPLSAHTLT
jgi:hypothetical protein